MKFDLKSMSKKDLEKLAKDVEKALDRIQKQEVKKVRQEMEKLAASHGMTVEDVLSTAPRRANAAKTPKKASPAKYANPTDPAQTWTGKGRQPEWFKSAVAGGTKPESMEI